MSLKETYLSNVENVKKQYPDAEIIEVTRSKNHVLSPSRPTLNLYNMNKNWDEYIRRFVKEMARPECVKEMARIGELAKTKDVYLVCFERIGHCHRFLLIEMIGSMYHESSIYGNKTGFHTADIPIEACAGIPMPPIGMD